MIRTTLAGLALVGVLFGASVVHDVQPASAMAHTPAMFHKETRQQMRMTGMMGTRQYSCILRLWDRESGWDKYAYNPNSGAYGIPQALPGGKMESAGRNWRDSAWVQIRWGLGYIRGVYGSACAAWWHELAYGWY